MITMSLTAVGLGGIGARLAFIDADGNLQAAGNLSFDGTTLALGTDIQLSRDAADVLGLRRGSNPEVFNIYKTFTDPSNFQRMALGFGIVGANTFSIRAQKAGTGGDSAIEIVTGPSNTITFGDPLGNWWTMSAASGHFFAATDNVRDIGAAGANRPRNIFAAGALVSRTKAGAPVDGDFTNPTDGMLAVDTTNSRIYARVGGAWKSAALA